MKKIVLVITITFTGYLVGCSNNSYPEYVIIQNGRFGYMSAHGVIVIPPQYEYANDFNEGYAVVRIDDYVPCVIDTSGKILWKLPYILVGSEVSDGLLSFVDTAAKDDMSSLGYFDVKTGKVAIKPQFDEFCGNFHNGLACVTMAGMIDEELCAPTFVYIDKTGKIVSEQNSGVEHFSDKGLLYVVPVGAGDNKYILVNRAFKNITGKYFTSIHLLGEGLAACELNDNYAIYNSKGRQLTEYIFSIVNEFNDGLCSVRDKKTGMCGYIDNTGHYAIKPQFQTTCDFSDGLAFVSTKNKSGFIDKKGNWVLVSDKILNVTDRGFRNGRCLVETANDKIMFIDKQGNFYPMPPDIKIVATFHGID